jgi:hypothetical protein
MTRSVLVASMFVLACIATTSPAAAANVAVLMPGSSGIVPGDFLVRNEGQFRGAGIRTIMTTSPSSAAEAVAAEIAQGRKIVMVGMSKGTVDVASALASGARPSGVVFVSGIHSRVMAALGSPGALPATLVVHHSQDARRRPTRRASSLGPAARPGSNGSTPPATRATTPAMRREPMASSSRTGRRCPPSSRSSSRTDATASLRQLIFSGR